MRGFAVPHLTPGAFVEKVRSAVADQDLDQMVRVTLRGDELVVSISRLGRSELRYRLTPERDGFRADLVAQRAAPLHTLYRQAFEETLAGLLDRVGATLTG